MERKRSFPKKTCKQMEESENAISLRIENAADVMKLKHGGVEGC